MLDRRTFVTALSSLPLRAQHSATANTADWRHIVNGWEIPDEHYADQPYVIITDQGHWLCTITTGGGVEGQQGQHIVSLISRDQGRTWDAAVAIEPATGPEASWVMPLKAPSGRIYAFYTFNAANVRDVPGAPGGMAKRVDTLGSYCFRYSDDHGRSWSRERYEIPLRQMAIDRSNNFQGKVLFFWGVGKPIIARGYAIFGFAKVGKWGQPGTMVESEGCFLRCDNILTERDPARLRWELLPDGDHGLRAPKGPVSDEANLVELSDGSLYATYRTIDGYNCHAYSRDGGHTWTPPSYAVYTPGGRPIKHPRAANFVKKFPNGKYLLWFHNHGGESVHLDPSWQAGGYYQNRNPAWICGGIEVNGHIHWSQPEILLYDDDPKVRISYPDLFEHNGRYFVTETQKAIARVHEVPAAFLETLWSQHSRREETRQGLLYGLPITRTTPGFDAVSVDLSARQGFTIETSVQFRELTAGQTLVSNWDPSTRRGLKIETNAQSALTLSFGDGRHIASWSSDPGTHPGTLRVGVPQHIAVIVDGGPKIISFVIDGHLNDGGPVRQFGWGRFLPEISTVPLGAISWHPPAGASPLPASGRVYGRALMVTEVIGNQRADIA